MEYKETVTPCQDGSWPELSMVAAPDSAASTAWHNSDILSAFFDELYLTIRFQFISSSGAFTCLKFFIWQVFIPWIGKPNALVYLSQYNSTSTTKLTMKACIKNKNTYIIQDRRCPSKFIKHLLYCPTSCMQWSSVCMAWIKRPPSRNHPLQARAAHNYLEAAEAFWL